MYLSFHFIATLAMVTQLVIVCAHEDDLNQQFFFLHLISLLQDNDSLKNKTRTRGANNRINQSHQSPTNACSSQFSLFRDKDGSKAEEATALHLQLHEDGGSWQFGI